MLLSSLLLLFPDSLVRLLFIRRPLVPVFILFASCHSLFFIPSWTVAILHSGTDAFLFSIPAWTVFSSPFLRGRFSLLLFFVVRSVILTSFVTGAVLPSFTAVSATQGLSRRLTLSQLLTSLSQSGPTRKDGPVAPRGKGQSFGAGAHQMGPRLLCPAASEMGRDARRPPMCHVIRFFALAKRIISLQV